MTDTISLSAASDGGPHAPTASSSPGTVRAAPAQGPAFARRCKGAPASFGVRGGRGGFSAAGSLNLARSRSPRVDPNRSAVTG